MKNNPYLALIEAVTNSDDNLGERQGHIEIYFESGRKKPWTFSVTDDGDGIAHRDIKEKLVLSGTRTSGLELGRNVRGNRGRGAQDMAQLGRVRYDTIHNGEYTRLEINRNGGVDIWPAAIATSDLRSTLKISKNGTRVTVTCDRATHPPAETARRKTTNLVGLRDIMNNPRRKVFFRYGDTPAEQIHFTPPVDRKLIDKWTFPVEGYPQKATLTLYESAHPFDEDPKDEARLGGLLIKGGRAIHQATLFNYEGRAAAQRLSGELRWDHLDFLTYDYDDREEKGHPILDSNPFAIIKRSREGLEPQHPAYKKLVAAVRPFLEAQIKRLEAEGEGTSAHVDESLRRRFAKLNNVLGDYWKTKQEEIDNDPTTSEPSASDAAFSVIPPRVRIDPAGYAVQTIQLRQEPRSDGSVPDLSPDVRVTIVEQQPTFLLSAPTTVQLSASAANPFVYRGTVKISAAPAQGEALIELAYGECHASLDVAVKPASPITLPATLEFGQQQYRLRPGKKKKIEIRAPQWFVERHGQAVQIRSKDPTVVTIADRKDSIRLKLRADALFYEASTTVVGLRLGQKTKLTATCGVEGASVGVSITEEDQRPKFETDIVSIPGFERARVTNELGTMTVLINGTHPAIARYLGKPPSYDNQKSPLARVMMAEVVASEIVQYFLREKYRGKTEVDVEALQVQRNREMARIGPPVHDVLVTNSEAALASPGRRVEAA